MNRLRGLQVHHHTSSAALTRRHGSFTGISEGQGRAPGAATTQNRAIRNLAADNITHAVAVRYRTSWLLPWSSCTPSPLNGPIRA